MAGEHENESVYIRPGTREAKANIIKDIIHKTHKLTQCQRREIAKPCKKPR